jgi:aspartyl-tRNA(Asn)/glutamyl-tRNA(Gln) amidotransferase subunit C
VEQLREVSTSDVPPTAHAVPVSNVFRPDEPHRPLTPEQALANAPQRDGHFFAVPKVLEQDSGA